MKNWHIIKEFVCESNIITCVCKWQGDGGTGVGDITSAWFIHRKEHRNDPSPEGFNKKHFVYAPGLIAPRGRKVAVK